MSPKSAVIIATSRAVCAMDETQHASAAAALHVFGRSSSFDTS